MIFRIKKPKAKPVIKMLQPGRRAEGEGWREITIGVDDDRIKVIENKPAEAPSQGRPIVVPAMGAMSIEAVDFLMDGARKSQEYGRDPRQMPMGEFQVWLQQRWLDFCEQKLRFLKGQTNIGPGGLFQREKPGIQDWTGVKPK